jgi:aminopeptidase N
MPRRAVTGLFLAPLALSLPLATALPAIAAPAAPRPITQTLAATRAHLVRNVRYDLHLDLTGTAETYQGTVTLQFAAKPITGDLVVDFADGEITALAVNHQAMPIRHDAGQLRLPGNSLRAENTVTVSFTGRYGMNGFGLVRFVDPVDQKVYGYTDLEPDGAHHVFPCFDQPDLKAHTTVHATTPAGWTVLSNRPAARTTRHGVTQTVDFAPTLPISPYLVALHAGDYVAWHDKAGTVPLGIYARASLARHMEADLIFAITKRGLAYYGQYFNYPYPFAKYDQVFVPEYQHGAMENPGAVTFNERYIYRAKPTDTQRFKRDSVILHEMAHMWFGDLVTMRWWNDLWLNESFATFMAAQANAALPRYGDSWQHFYGQKQWAYDVDSRKTTHPIQGAVADTEVATGSFDGITYGKGASVMKQVSYLIGPNAFRDGLRLYFKRHAFGNATLADFLAALQQKTRQDLKAWGREWLATAGLNAIAPQWSCANGVIGDLRLVQSTRSGESRLRSHRTEIGLLYPNAEGKLVVTTRLPVAYSSGTTPVPALKGKPCPKLVFPNVGDQDYAKAILDPVSVATAQQSLSDVADPFLRLQVWDGLWQMVLDRQIEPLSYLDTLKRHLPKETNPTAVDQQLTAMGLLVHHYLDRDTRQQVLPDVERFVWEQLALQPAGSDQQQYWANAAIALSRTPEGQQRLLDWFHDESLVKGLALDQGRRWEILAALTACGHPEAKAHVAAEAKLDPSDRGLRALDVITAAVPDVAGKQAAWERIINDRTSSISVLTAVMDGFAQPDQVELTRPFADRYFDTVLEVYRNRPYAFASRFASRMFPKFSSDQAIVGRAQALLKQQDLPSELRKWLTDLTEDLERRAGLQTMARQALSQRRTAAARESR